LGINFAGGGRRNELSMPNEWLGSGHINAFF